jgi:hypothetical protein
MLIPMQIIDDKNVFFIGSPMWFFIRSLPCAL